LKKRKIAGSRLIGGKAGRTVAGFCSCKRAEALVGGRRFGPGKLLLLTRGQRKRSWFFEQARSSPTGWKRSATWSVRGRIVILERGRKRRAGEASALSGAHRLFFMKRHVHEIGRSWRHAVKRNLHSGPDCRKVVRRRAPAGRQGSRALEMLFGGGRHNKRCGPGNRAIAGCSFRNVSCRSR